MSAGMGVSRFQSVGLGSHCMVGPWLYSLQFHACRALIKGGGTYDPPPWERSLRQTFSVTRSTNVGVGYGVAGVRNR